METSILTDDQKRQWTEDGYLLLKGVLSPHEVKNLAAAVDKMYAEHLKQPDAKPEAGLNRLNIVEANNIFVNRCAARDGWNSQRFIDRARVATREEVVQTKLHSLRLAKSTLLSLLIQAHRTSDFLKVRLSLLR